MAGSWGVELWNCCSAAPPTHKRQQVQRRELQLVAVSAMLIDCKYEEIWAPEVNDFIFISDSAYTREQILAMEKGILNKLQWNLTIPTPYVFIMMLSASADNKSDKEHMAFFFAELALMQYGLVAYASAVYAARPNPLPFIVEQLEIISFTNAEALKFKRLSQSRQQLIDWSVKIKISKEHGGFMRFIQVSCLGASASSSRMLRAKAAGEESVLKEFPEPLRLLISHRQSMGTCILNFHSRIQPVYVVDVAAAIVNSLKDDGTSMGKSYGLGGPEIYTVHDLAELMYETICEWPRYIDVPLPIARLTVSSRCGILDSGGEQRGIHDNRDRQWLGSVLEPLEFEKDDFFQKKKDWGPVQI
uniref:Cyclin N-terminal domain-containing protein n=1 Tax=Oryza rufipogon TaxID=4529 RepID=A0A0E0NM91_ORYRU